MSTEHKTDQGKTDDLEYVGRGIEGMDWNGI